MPPEVCTTGSQAAMKVRLSTSDRLTCVSPKGSLPAVFTPESTVAAVPHTMRSFWRMKSASCVYPDPPGTSPQEVTCVMPVWNR